MGQFLPLYAGLHGFDAAARPRWQMVPVNGDRYVILRDGAGLCVNKTSPEITLREIAAADVPGGLSPAGPGDRIFLLHGLSRGATHIRATRADGSLVTQLDVGVKSPRTVRTSFHFVWDDAGHHTERPLASVADRLREMDRIYVDQANVHVQALLVRPVTVRGDLGPTIRTARQPSPTDAWRRVVHHRDPGAQVNVFFVWRLDVVDSDADEVGVERGGDCLVEDTRGANVTRAVAHEIGHALGLLDQYQPSRRNELMFGECPGGLFLPKADINRINPA